MKNLILAAAVVSATLSSPATANSFGIHNDFFEVMPIDPNGYTPVWPQPYPIWPEPTPISPCFPPIPPYPPIYNISPIFEPVMMLPCWDCPIPPQLPCNPGHPVY